ncbi:MAG: ADP-ribosylation factor-directed GTPase activating protein isoform b [Planctomycetaceae bacterium]|nr:MAG: ADP-ribosylation factor-directed GTPase activating protein isoform b [Planctomycetaceae bacterium]
MKPTQSLRSLRPIGLVLLLGSLVGCPVGSDQIWREPPEMLVEATANSSKQAESAEAESPIVDVSSAGEKGVPDQDPLVLRVGEALRAGREGRQLSTDRHAAWQIMHGVLAYGRGFEIQTSAGMRPAVDFALGGGPIKGLVLRGGDRFETPDGSIRGVVAELDPGQKIGQGHRDQWLAYMARSDLGAEDVIQTLDGPLALEGWLRQMEWDVPLNFEREYSWTLVALVTHRPTTHTWTARDGRTYSIDSLLQSEVGQLGPDSACGGSHRLCAIATAINARRAAGLPISGVWEDAEDVVSLAIEQVRDFQNADGSFSTHYFDRPGWSLDLTTTLGTTGHAFEFLAVAGDEDLLREPWVRRAAEILCDILERTAGLDLECGALYHALSGLSIYHERMTAGSPAAT